MREQEEYLIIYLPSESHVRQIKPKYILKVGYQKSKRLINAGRPYKLTQWHTSYCPLTSMFSSLGSHFSWQIWPNSTARFAKFRGSIIPTNLALGSNMLHVLQITFSGKKAK